MQRLFSSGKRRGHVRKTWNPETIKQQLDSATRNLRNICTMKTSKTKMQGNICKTYTMGKTVSLTDTSLSSHRKRQSHNSRSGYCTITRETQGLTRLGHPTSLVTSFQYLLTWLHPVLAVAGGIFLVVACQLLMWDLTPWPGVKTRHWQHGVLATGPLGKSLSRLFKENCWGLGIPRNQCHFYAGAQLIPVLSREQS